MSMGEESISEDGIDLINTGKVNDGAVSRMPVFYDKTA